ncbi:hypothetical protein [Embleya hyalina]|uniref:Uncharacterized protein n=1 Tax=Embleya hyalina TaxID=516124 RepID=A0A401Z0H5_9ACTN|nr:hypothetical protein [Embleya hyalina]GCE00403.1 hypothetical protein EHYA_08128 [Embleya hyalina]
MGKTKTGPKGGDSGASGTGHDTTKPSGGAPTATVPKAPKRPGGDTGGPPGGPPATTTSKTGGPAGPPPRGGNGFSHKPEHVESGARGIDASAARIEAAHTKLSGVLQAKGSFWNKDSLGQTFGKVFEPLSTGHTRAGGALQQAVAKTAGNVRVSAKKTAATEEANLKKFGQRIDGDPKKIGDADRDGKGPSGNAAQKPGPNRTPVYFVDENGRVHQLVNGQLVPVTHGGTNSGIDRVLNPDGTIRVNIKTDAKGNPEVTPKGKPKRVPVPGGKGRYDRFSKKEQADNDSASPRTPVQSQPLQHPTDLSQAVEDVRRAGNDYGGNNYASLYYQDPSGHAGGDFILVGSSGQNGGHSERAIGLPMVHNGMQNDVTRLYTERAPCQVFPQTGGAGCDLWVDMHLNGPGRNSPLEVSHVADFDSSRLDGADRNGPFNRYMFDLEQHHRAGNTSPLAGVYTYRYP